MTSPNHRQSSAANLGDRAAKEKAQALVGTVLSGRYRIAELLAMGGVGAVYLGEHVKMHKHVAIKVLHPDAANLPDIAARFEREAVAGAHIQHPNVAVATDFGELDDGTHFLVLEYVKGTTLREVIKRGPISVARAVGIIKQIAAALGATHAAGIVHRDVKPRNVMLIEGERDVVKLIDFGLAKLNVKEVSELAASRASMADQQITGTGAVFGTIAYLAPEAALGMDSVDVRADLYALGLVLYEMLAGRHPFETGDPVALFKHHARTIPPPIAERAPGVTVPPSVEAVVQKLLAKRRDDRYPNAEAVIAALDAAWEGSAHTPTPSPVSLGEHVFPGPSILPPPPATTPPPPVAAPIARAPLSTSPPSMPSATAPSAVRDIESPVPSPPGRSRWLYVAGIAGMALVAAAVWWSGSETTTGGVATVAAAETTASAKSSAASAAPSTMPSSSAGPSAAATGSPSSAPAVVAMDPGVARAALRRAAAARDVYRGQEAFYALADREPAAFREPVVAAATRDLATATALAGGAEMDRLFDALAHKLGGDGLDILYEIVRVRGGSKAAMRAEDALRASGVLDNATPALRVTWLLRDAPCAEKAALLDKAASEGDARTLMVMQTTALSCLGAQNEALRNATKTLTQKQKGR
ncbi:serine/threonine protein kinase [Minicystis rosea]|nr:serine/threonine protein kinase [Minicystis rosea]